MRRRRRGTGEREQSQRPRDLGSFERAEASCKSGDSLSVVKSERAGSRWPAMKAARRRGEKAGGKRGITWRLDLDLFQRVEVLFQSGVLERGEVGESGVALAGDEGGVATKKGPRLG